MRFSLFFSQRSAIWRTLIAGHLAVDGNAGISTWLRISCHSLGNILAAKKNFFLAKSDEGIVPGIWKVLSAGAALCHVCKYDSAGGIGSLVEIQSLTWFALDFCLAWFISTVRFLRKKPVWISVLVLDIVGAILLRQFPLSITGKPRTCSFWWWLFLRICSIPAELSGHSHRSSTKRDDSLLCFALVKRK